MRFAYIPTAFGGDSLPFVGEILNTYGDDLAILERVFAGCNHGSGQEFPAFMGSGKRSLSAGDLVTLEGKGTWVCKSFGWEKVDRSGFR